MPGAVSTGRPGDAHSDRGRSVGGLTVTASWGATTTLAEPTPLCLAPRSCRSVNCNDAQTDHRRWNRRGSPTGQPRGRDGPVEDLPAVCPASHRSTRARSVPPHTGQQPAVQRVCGPRPGQRLPPPGRRGRSVRLRKPRGPPRLTAGRTTPLALRQGGSRRASASAVTGRCPAAHGTARFLTIDQVAEELDTHADEPTAARTETSAVTLRLSRHQRCPNPRWDASRPGRGGMRIRAGSLPSAFPARARPHTGLDERAGKPCRLEHGFEPPPRWHPRTVRSPAPMSPPR
jgi:hypothetical protein